MNNNANAANANYNYEEYDYNNMNTSINNSIGDDLLNNRINNVLGSGGDIMPTSTTSTINPSNNFLLYYYVEYM